MVRASRSGRARAVVAALAAIACAGAAGPLRCTVAPGEHDAPPPLPPAADRRFLRDQGGGALVLRGVNLAASAKWAPDRLHHPSDAHLRRLRRDLGLSAVRLLVFWEAIEPAPGRYDAAYLAAVRALVERAAAHDLRVVVDVHQDVFGEGFGFAGAPDWACAQDRYDDFVRPARWFESYLERPVIDCFHAFWGSETLRGRYGRALAALARALDGAPGLVGYDLFNEPHWGHHDPDRFEARVAPAAYRAWSRAIRAVDPDAWVLFQPTPLRAFGGPSTLPPLRTARAVYAPHHYDLGVELEGAWDGDAGAIARWARRAVADARRLGVPALVGEVGARRTTRGAVAYVDALHDALDRAMLSAFHYEGGRGVARSYALFGPGGEATALLAPVARPHPERVAGQPLGWSWDATSRTFRLRWHEDPTVGGATRVTLPRLGLGAAPAVELVPDGPTRVEGGALLVAPVGAGPRRLTLRGLP